MSTMSFNEAIGWAAAVCATKAVVMHLLQTRSRLITGDMKTGRITAWVEDTMIPEPIIALFKLAMGTSLGGAVPIDRLGGVAQNNAQNEPYFLLLSGALALAGSAPANGVDLIKYYVYARLVHNAAFLNGPITLGDMNVPVRAITYTVAVACTFLMAKDALRIFYFLPARCSR